MFLLTLIENSFSGMEVSESVAITIGGCVRVPISVLGDFL